MSRAVCASCHAPVRWVTTPTGKAMPIDPEQDPRGTILLFEGLDSVLAVVVHATVMPHAPRFVSHFATCEFAAQHRRARV